MPERRAPLARRIRSETGQTTAEYALVILAAAALATLLIAWASNSDAIGRLFDAVFERVLNSDRP
jgi:Flp pilus assembly pilin Flp